LRLLFPLVYLLVVKEVLWEEADNLVAIFDPKLDSDLDPAAREKLVSPVPHGYVLSIKNDQGLLSLHQRLARLVCLIDLREKSVHGCSFLSLTLTALALFP